MILTTRRTILRPFEESDAKEIYKYANDPRVGPIAGWKPHTCVENSRQIIKDILSAPETYAIVLKDTGMPIGSIGLMFNTDIAKGKNEAELGFWLGVPFWGNGLVAEAGLEVLRHGFEDLELERILCGYYDGNLQSKRVQEKLNFKYQYTNEQADVPQMGETRKAYINLLTKEDWFRCEYNNTAVLYVHGKGGNPDESEHYKPLFPRCNVKGLDYKSFIPWEAKNEIQKAVSELKSEYKKVVLIANSIGAYLSMNAGIEKLIDRAFFISPIVDMEKLIGDMLLWANTDEEELKKKGVIHTNFGEDLSFEYLSYVRKNPLKWNVPTEILYGGKDNLTSLETITDFSYAHKARLTIMENGEHWFHTEEQMQFLDDWIKRYGY